MKKTLFLLFFNVLSLIHAQFLKYTDIAPMPEPRTGIDATAYNGKIYIAGGYSNTGYYSDILVYDIASNTYTKFSLAELGAIRYANVEISGGKLYVFNGQKNDGSLNSLIFIYDINNPGFTIAQNPYPVRQAGSSVDKNGNIYFFGGANADETVFYNRLVKYVPSSSTFTLMANLPTAMETKGEVVGDFYLYTFGGFNGSTTSSAIYQYNLTENIWVTLNATVSGGISANTVTTDGSRLFLTGDYTNLTSNKIYEAANNVSKQVYDTTQNGMIGRRHHASVIVNNKLYIFGGNTTAATSSALANAQVANLPMNIGMIGSFTQWNWEIPLTTSDGINYFYGAKDTPLKYIFGETELKFRGNYDWVNNWGYSTFPTGTAVQNGQNIPIKAGSYYIYFNKNTGVYNFSTTLLGTDEVNKEKELSFYPNPAIDKIIFNRNIKEIKVYDISGKQKNVNFDKNEVSVSELSTGTYLIKVVTYDGNTFTKNLIKQ